MSFQILNKEGQAITINELDAEAATFWNKAVDPEHYATPTQRREGEKDFEFIHREGNNWFDAIGYHIHSPSISYKVYSDGWKNVKCSMFITQVDSIVVNPLEEQIDQIKFLNEVYFKPYFDLIDHWDSKGYTPKRVED